MLGKIDSQGASSRLSKPSRTMLPQVAVGGGTPSPMKARVDSVRIAVASQSEASTTTSSMMFGRMWPNMMRRSE